MYRVWFGWEPKLTCMHSGSVDPWGAQGCTNPESVFSGVGTAGGVERALLFSPFFCPNVVTCSCPGVGGFLGGGQGSTQADGHIDKIISDGCRERGREQGCRDRGRELGELQSRLRGSSVCVGEGGCPGCGGGGTGQTCPYPYFRLVL